MDAWLKPGLCGKYMGDIGVAARTASELVENIDILFEKSKKLAQNSP